MNNYPPCYLRTGHSLKKITWFKTECYRHRAEFVVEANKLCNRSSALSFKTIWFILLYFYGCLIRSEHFPVFLQDKNSQSATFRFWGAFLKLFYLVSFLLRCWVTSQYAPEAFQWQNDSAWETLPRHTNNKASPRPFGILRLFWCWSFKLQQW